MIKSFRMGKEIIAHIVNSAKIAQHNVTKDAILSQQFCSTMTVAFDEEKVLLYLCNFAIKDQWVSVGQSVDNRKKGILTIFVHAKNFWHLYIVNLQGTVDTYAKKIRDQTLLLKRKDRLLKQRKNYGGHSGASTPTTISGGESDSESFRDSVSEREIRTKLRQETTQVLTLEEQLEEKNKKLDQYKSRYAQLIGKYKQAQKKLQDVNSQRDEQELEHSVQKEKIKSLQGELDKLEDRFEMMMENSQTLQHERDKLIEENSNVARVLNAYTNEDTVNSFIDEKLSYAKKIYPLQTEALGKLYNILTTSKG